MTTGRSPEPTRWERLQILFERALALAPDGRSAYLDAECGGDRSLRREIDEMLSAETGECALGIERLVNDGGNWDADRLVGLRLGSWRVLGLIGRGGMGLVYEAERADGHYDQRVALKLVGGGASGHAAAFFQAERRILARLTHPNIARLLDAGFTPEGSAYMAMELVDGLPITTYCDTHRLGIEDRLRLFRIVCDATQHAHQALVVHRDLKPSNIFVSRDGQVKLLDFGVAKLLQPDPGMPDLATREHRAVTLAYAAPEQIRGEPVTTATDVYALGVVLYELLAGRRPFEAPVSSSLEIERLITTTDPAPPSQVLSVLAADAAGLGAIAAVRNTTGARLVKRLRGDLDRIVLKALRPEAGRRYASAGHFGEDIDRYLAGLPVNARPDSLAYRAKRFVGRNRVGVAAASALVLLLAAFSVAMALQARRIAAERDRAQAEQGRAEQVISLLVDLFQTANPDVVPGGDRLAIGEFLERAERRALRELTGQPELASRLRHVLGLMHHARSNNARARELLETAFEEQHAASGPDSREALAIQIDLAGLLAWLDHRDRARALLDDALARIVRTLGADHVLAAEAFHVLADVVQDTGQAADYLERAVGIARRRLPLTDRDRIRYTAALATRYLQRGRRDDARNLFDEALNGAEALNQGRTTALVSVLLASAALDNSTGDFAAAEARQRRALALATDLVGADSFQVADALNDLAVSLASQGRLREAADTLKDSYERHAALFGEGHWRTANTMRNVGMAMLLLDDAEECARWMARAAAGMEEAARTRGALYMRAQLARCLIRGGRTGEGIALLEPAIEGLHAFGADVANYTANARLWLGRALLEEGRIDAAEPLVSAAVDHYRRTREADHPARAEAECELAHVLAARGRLDDARAAFEACVPRIAGYGQMEPWRRHSAEQRLEELRAKVRTQGGS